MRQRSAAGTPGAGALSRGRTAWCPLFPTLHRPRLAGMRPGRALSYLQDRGSPFTAFSLRTGGQTHSETTRRACTVVASARDHFPHNARERPFRECRGVAGAHGGLRELSGLQRPVNTRVCAPLPLPLRRVSEAPPTCRALPARPGPPVLERGHVSEPLQPERRERRERAGSAGRDYLHPRSHPRWLLRQSPRGLRHALGSCQPKSPNTGRINAYLS